MKIEITIETLDEAIGGMLVHLQRYLDSDGKPDEMYLDSFNRIAKAIDELLPIYEKLDKGDNRLFYASKYYREIYSKIINGKFR